MKRILFVILLFSSFARAQFPIPNFILSDSYCNVHNLHDYLSHGNAVILDFFMLSCGNCSQFAPELENIYQSFGSNTSSVKVISMEVSDTATYESINLWKQVNGSTYPTIGGHDAYLYWNDNYKAILGGTVNQIIAIIPNTGNPINSSVPYIEIGIMDSSKIQNLYNTLATYGYHVGIENKSKEKTELKTYPNPASDNIHFKVSASMIQNHQKIYCTIYDLKGLLLKAIEFSPYHFSNEISIPINDLSNGLYLLRVKSQHLKKQVKFQVLK